MKVLYAFLILMTASLAARSQTPSKQAGSSSPGSQSTTPSSTSGSSSIPNAIIVFDYKTKLTTPPATPIPFDRRFYLQITDSVPTNNIRNIYVYPIKYSYRNGGRLFEPDSESTGQRNPSDRVSKLKAPKFRRMPRPRPYRSSFPQ